VISAQKSGPSIDSRSSGAQTKTGFSPIKKGRKKLTCRLLITTREECGASDAGRRLRRALSKTRARRRFSRSRNYPRRKCTNHAALLAPIIIPAPDAPYLNYRLKTLALLLMHPRRSLTLFITCKQN